MNTEIWKPVLDYIGIYEVSNLGRVRSLKFGKIKILKLQSNKYGYITVNLCKNGKSKTFQVHRLVWLAFKGEIPEGYEINHIDEDASNPCLDNLNLLTHTENINYGTHNQKVIEKRSDPVLQLTLDGELVKEWPSMAEAERQTGISHTNISNCCNGKRKQTNGFKWVKKLPLS